ncbi:MAG: dienelactone hydrolase family protein [Ilumatobacteraceae bacterium]
MTGGAAPLDGWATTSFTAAGITRDVYRKGSGPGVVVVHELPGITPAVEAFAEEVVAAGFTVVMPSLVGTPGRDISGGYTMRSLLQVCVSREFTTWAMNRTSPIIAYLRAVARHLHLEVGGPGVGAIGMCFSGGFALAMMVDETIAAPVLSQPSLPFAVGKKRSANLALSPDDALAVAQRATDGCAVLGLRFTGDKMVGTRFATLRQTLGDAFQAVEFPSAHKMDHSVLTEHRQQAGVERVLAFLNERLAATA